MKLILENWRKFLKEAEWSKAADFDYPAEDQPKYAKNLKSQRVIVFGQDDSYDVSGETHGRDSHTIKHHVEFFPDQIRETLNNTLNFIKGIEQEVHVIEGGKTQPIKKEQINLGDLLNTFDFINDKKINGESLKDIEAQIYKKYMLPLISQYDGMADEMMSSNIDVSNAAVETREKLVLLLSKQPIIKFKAVYSGQEKEYIVNVANSAMVALAGGRVATLFNRLKKSPGKTLSLRQALKDFATGKSTVPTDEYSIFRDYIDEISSQQQPQPEKKKKQPQQKTGPNIRAMAQGMARGGKSLEDIQAQIMKITGKTIDVSNIEKMIGPQK